MRRYTSALSPSHYRWILWVWPTYGGWLWVEHVRSPEGGWVEVAHS